MKHRIGLIFVTLGLAACAQGPDEPTDTTEQAQGAEVAAESPAAPEARHHRKHDPAKLVEKLDQNKNGTIELTELPEHKKRWLESADTDKNGSITVAELEAHKKEMATRHFAEKDGNKDGFLTQEEVGERKWSKLSVADADKDGKLSQAELSTAHAEGKLMRGFGGKHGRGGFKKDPSHFIEKFDANDNGSLELTELPEHKRERLGAADTDKDGKLTAEELKAHFAARMKEHGARFRKDKARDEQAL